MLLSTFKRKKQNLFLIVDFIKEQLFTNFIQAHLHFVFLNFNLPSFTDFRQQEEDHFLEIYPPYI